MSDYPPPPMPPGPPGPPGSSWPPPSPVPPLQQVGYGWTTGHGRELAGFWIRFAASFIDGLILGVPMSILSFVLDDSGTITVGSGPIASPNASLLVNLISTVVGVVYYSALEGGATGQTLGKRLCSIRVVDVTTGQPGIGVGRGVGRYFARILSGLPLLLGYFWMLWDKDKQTWHDKMVRTIVVKL